MLVGDNLSPAAAFIGENFKFLYHRFRRSAQNYMFDEKVIVDIIGFNVDPAVSDDPVE